MGYDKETTPNLDVMASRGILFKEAISERSSTDLMVSSLLTSKSMNGRSPREAVPSSDNVMLSEVVDTYLVTGCGCFQGAGENREGWRRGFKEINVLLYRHCTDMTTQLLKHIRSHRDGLFMVHFIDTHVPYRAGAYRDTFDVSEYPQKGLSMHNTPYGVYKDRLRQFRYDFEVPAHVMHNLGFHMAQYDGAIKAIDSQVERIRQHLATEDAIIFLADHGELFGEYDYYCNHPEYDSCRESLHVPLLLYSEELFRPAVVSKEVSLLDVAPTVCELIQVPIPKTFEGKPLLSFCGSGAGE